MTLMKDFGWVVLIVLLMPLIMAVAFVAVAIIMVQSLYRWARGNTTSTSRIAAHHADASLTPASARDTGARAVVRNQPAPALSGLE